MDKPSSTGWWFQRFGLFSIIYGIILPIDYYFSRWLKLPRVRVHSGMFSLWGMPGCGIYAKLLCCLRWCPKRRRMIDQLAKPKAWSLVKSKICLWEMEIWGYTGDILGIHFGYGGFKKMAMCAIVFCPKPVDLTRKSLFSQNEWPGRRKFVWRARRLWLWHMEKKHQKWRHWHLLAGL